MLVQEWVDPYQEILKPFKKLKTRKNLEANWFFK